MKEGHEREEKRQRRSKRERERERGRVREKASTEYVLFFERRKSTHSNSNFHHSMQRAFSFKLLPKIVQQPFQKILFLTNLIAELF